MTVSRLHTLPGMHALRGAGTRRTPSSSGSTAAPARTDSLPERRVGRWPVRVTLALLLLGTAALYLWGLSASGYANTFYSAAAQAGSQSWKAFFFGSLDAGNSITVDKPPAAIWLMALSVRLFGLSSWSILVPEALLGVGAVWLTYATVARVLSSPVEGRRTLTARAHWAGIAGAAIFALTPAATLMFRFNNPDALLVFLSCAATYCTVRAIEHAPSTRFHQSSWLIGAGVLVGFGFLTKMLQAFLILPALVVAYAIAAPTTWRKKLAHLLGAFAAMVGSLGWYVAIVELVPVSWRPYIGGSQNNSILELVFGYNGLGRITGNEVGSVTGGGGMTAGQGGMGASGGMWGETGITRMFAGVSGGMVSWLIPAALILAVAALIVTRSRMERAGLIVFAGTLVVTGLVFSFMAGIYHDYYTVALAPAIGGSVGVAFAILWSHRDRLFSRIAMAVALSATGVWALALASQAGGIYHTIGMIALVGCTLAALGVLALRWLPKIVVSLVVAFAVAGGIAGPAAYAINTAATPHQGSIVTAGPVQDRGPGGHRGPGGAPGARTDGRSDGGMPPAPPNGQVRTGTQAPAGTQGQTGAPGQPGGAMGGLMGGQQVSAEMTDLLRSDANSYTWVAAAIGSQNAASLQLASEYPVMAIGGFNGSDPSPTLAQFQQLVASGQIHYFIAGGMHGQQNGGSDSASQIGEWVAANFTATTVGSTTVYDLTARS